MYQMSCSLAKMKYCGAIENFSMNLSHIKEVCLTNPSFLSFEFWLRLKFQPNFTFGRKFCRFYSSQQLQYSTISILNAIITLLPYLSSPLLQPFCSDMYKNRAIDVYCSKCQGIILARMTVCLAKLLDMLHFICVNVGWA